MQPCTVPSARVSRVVCVCAPSIAEPTVSAEEMKAAKLPISYRDYCAHLLIPLNKCRQETFYLPYKCMDERHGYEKCQYVE